MAKKIEIFKPGTHTAIDGTKLTFSEQDMADVVEGYDVGVHEAPVVIGHPTTNGPAYAWVKSVEFSEGSLFMEPQQVNPDFAELVDQGAYKKVSASFYLPTSPANPKPGSLYLRHVGFLGATPPSLKGLKPAAFAEGEEGVVTVEFGENDRTFAWSLRSVGTVLRNIRDYIISKEGLEEADKVIPDWPISSLTESAAEISAQANQADEAATPAFAEDNSQQPKNEETPDMAGQDDAPDGEELKKQEADLAADKEKLNKDKAEFAEAQTRSAATTFIDGQITAGKFPPAQRDATIDFMSRLDAGDTVSFGEGDDNQMSQSAFFQKLVEGLPQIVNFGEVSGEDGVSTENANPEAIAEKAVAYREEMAGKGVVVTTTQAVDHVTSPNT